MEGFLNWFYTFFDINRIEYPPIQVTFLAIGFIFWIIAYREIIWGIIKYKIVEIPMIVAAMDIAWEFNWGFLLKNDFSWLFKYGCILWFLMDVFINYSTIKYGRKLVTNWWIKKYYVFIYLFILIGAGFLVYWMRILHEDEGMGLFSAYLINLCISSSYILQLLHFPQYRGQGFQFRVAWSKCIGTGSISVMCFLHYPTNYFLQTMCVMVFIMDILYIYLFKNYQPQPSKQ